jgi:hypothetical protein
MEHESRLSVGREFKHWQRIVGRGHFSERGETCGELPPERPVARHEQPRLDNLTRLIRGQGTQRIRDHESRLLRTDQRRIRAWRQMPRDHLTRRIHKNAFCLGATSIDSDFAIRLHSTLPDTQLCELPAQTSFVELA